MKHRSGIVPLLASAALLGACSGGMQAPAVGPADVPSLEAAVAAQPADADALTRLGVAYYNARRHADAADALDRAVATGEAAPVAHLSLGLAHEAAEDWQQASAAYAAFLGSAPADSELRGDIERRVALVERELMHEQLETMVAQEAALSNQPAQPRTIAVFPFRVVADDPRYAPLQYALADMVTTDLGIPGSLQLLERAQIQALVQEMALSLAGYTDAASGARVGRLMRAEHVVQGSVVLLDADRLRMEMAVVDPAQGVRTGTADDETALEQIFDTEKRMVLELFDVLGITLTAAEREAIEENRTGSLLAMLAYGEGLEAMDRGDFGAAANAFGNAATIDPGFQAAQARAQEASGLRQAAETSGSAIAAAAESQVPGTDAVELTLVDQIIPDINRSGADDLGTNPTPGNEIQRQPPSNEVDSGVVSVPIIVDNPTRP